MKKIQMILLFVFVTFGFACGLIGKQSASADEALKALKKIDAATQVGVDRFTYKQLLIEAKTKVDTAEANLPKGKLRDSLGTAFYYYERADFYWGEVGIESQSLQNAWRDARQELKTAAELAE